MDPSRFLDLSRAKLCLSVLVLIFMEAPLAFSHDDPELILGSDGPAVLDSNISFSAVLLHSEHIQGPFWFVWSDDASPGNFLERKTNERSMNHSFSYSSKHYKDRYYTMTVTVFKEMAFFREEIAKKEVDYHITNQLNGEIVIYQDGRLGHNISSMENVKFDVKIHDPSGFLDGASIDYFWFVNDTNYGPTENSTFLYKFLHPGISTAEVMVLAKVGADPNGIWQNQSEQMRAVPSLSKASLMPSSPALPPYLKSGVFRTSVNSVVPITNLSIVGDNWVKHGNISRLKVLCDGSGPFTFCWEIKNTPYNATGNETCIAHVVKYDQCDFNFSWYFRTNGTFGILIVVDNGISKHVEVVSVTIYEVQHHTPLSLVVVPICSCLIAVIAVGLGVSVWLNYKKNLTVETADFDFNSPDEQLEFKTFWERLRDSMVNGFSNASDDVSYISSVSSKSATPPANIHYGSIR